MGQLSLTDLTTEVQDYIPSKPMAQVGRAANNIIKRIYRHIAPVDRSTFTTTPPYTTGTVDPTQGDIALLGTGTAWDSTFIGALIQISGSNTWYTIAAVPGAGQITLSSAWDGSTSTGKTYKIVYPFVEFPSTVLRTINIWRTPRDKLLFAASSYEEQILASPVTGQPRFYVPARMDIGAGTDDNFRLQLLPAPDTYYTYTYDFQRRPTLYTPSSGSTYSDLPSTFDDAIIAGTLMLCWDQEDKQDRAMYWKGEFLSLLREALAEVGSVLEPELEDNEGYFMGPLENRPIS